MRTRLDSLQVLRAVAALAVVFFHTGYTPGSLAPAGSFGVDIFFVISGFIMAMICGSESAYFFRKRLVRIIPLYWTLTLLTFTILLKNPRVDTALSRGTTILLKSLFFIPYTRSDGSLFPVLVVGWTLNYELCFYLLIAVALALAPRHSDLVASLLLIAVMLVMHRLPPTPIPYFFSRPIMLEFIAGIVAFHIYTTATLSTCVRLRPLFYLLIPSTFTALALVQACRVERIPHLISWGSPPSSSPKA